MIGSSSRGFSLMEMIIAIVLIGIIMIPISLMMLEYVRASATGDSLTIMVGMTVKSEASTRASSDMFGVGSSGKGIREKENLSFNSSGGSAELDSATVTVSNQRTCNLTITGIDIYSSSGDNRTVISVIMNGYERLSSGQYVYLTSSAAYVEFHRYFYPQASQTYSGTYYFQSLGYNAAYSVTLRYVFIDGSKSDWYTYTYNPGGYGYGYGNQGYGYGGYGYGQQPGYGYGGYGRQRGYSGYGPGYGGY